MNKISDYINIKEAAELMGVSENTLRNWHNAGKLKAYKSPLSKYRMYKKEELELILKQIEESGV